MLQFITKDITTVDFGVVGHGVNCRHKFRSGVAGAIRDKFPMVYDRYMDMPSGPEMLGSAHVIRITPMLHIANLYTQVDYGYDGKQYADLPSIQRCVETLCEWATQMEIEDVYLPQIGCKRGGLDWDAQVLPVLNMIQEQYPQLTITICIHEE